MKKKEQELAIHLLDNALWFINGVPNHKYRCRDYDCSYDLASELTQFLNSLKKDKNDSGTKEN